MNTITGRVYILNNSEVLLANINNYFTCPILSKLYHTSDIINVYLRVSVNLRLWYTPCYLKIHARSNSFKTHKHRMISNKSNKLLCKNIQ